MTETFYAPSPDARARHQVDEYESSNGERGNTLNGKPVVILTTVGRRSGAIRKSPLMRVSNGESYAVVASYGGAPKHPVWYLNMKDNPEVELQDGAVRRRYRAHDATGTERAEWWMRAAEVWPAYDDYQKKTDREIPLVVLDPID